MKIAITLTLFLYVSTLQALKFHSYVNEKGETVFSNVPDNCIKDSTLTCLKYHPVFSSAPEATLKPESIPNQSGHRTNSAKNSPSNRDHINDLFGKKGSGLQLDMLERVLEMNKLMNEYYPGEPDPDDASRVRQQQDEIMDVLRVIRNSVGGDQKPSIDRAMDILRSNLVD